MLILLFFLFIFSLLLFGCSNNNSDRDIQRPNIIWIYADDHDQKAISAYGESMIQTPNIDRIAGEGMVFTNSFVSNSICSPARAVVLTGKFSHMNGVKDNKTAFDSAQQTFPKILRESGYQTALVGKWHLRSTPSGFDYWNKLPGQGNYYDPVFIENGDTLQTEGYVTDIITDFALEFLENERDPEKPFFLMVQNKAPHGPWMPAPRHLSLFANDTFPLADHFYHNCSLRGTPACEQEMEIYKKFSERHTLAKLYEKEKGEVIGEHWLTWLYSLLNPQEQEAFDRAYLSENREYLNSEMTEDERKEWMYQRYIKDYLRCVTAVDENVGRLLDYLEESGLDENTILMYSSDQGFYLGEFGWYDKRFMYEKSMRTPLIVKWPGVTRPGSECDEMVQNIDMAETFLDIAGLESPEDMQGISLLPLLKNPDQSIKREALYYHYYEFPRPHHVYPHYGVRTQNSKLIHFYTLDEWEYYNLEKDPDELVNQIDNPEYEKHIEELKLKIEELQETYQDNSI